MTPAKKRPAVAFVSYRAARSTGDGGNHRTYQILLDLQAEFGADRVHAVTVEEWFDGPEYTPPNRPRGAAGLRSLPRRTRRRLSRMTENPCKLLTREGWSHSMSFGTQGVLSQEFVAYYQARIRAVAGVDVCVVDHPLFEQIRMLNCDRGIPTVIASQNIESLDVGRLRLDRTLAAYTATIDLANELRSLARYDERFAISKVEASLIGGVGLSCQFYPYLPTGAIRAQLQEVASIRRGSVPEPDLFLLLGTAHHPPTRMSLEWFLRHAVERGLPRGARVVVVGNKVTELVPAGVTIPGMEFRGRVPDAELADLLAQAGTALVPQRMGFGALTRIPELVCAGLPVLAFPHASYAIDAPPGLQVVRGNDWSSLVEQMQARMDTHTSVDPAAYVAWENQASRPLGQTLRYLIANGSPN